jgi:hypothetical protein
MNIEFISEVCAYFYYIKDELIYNIIPCFIEKNPKQHLKYMVSN